LHINKNSSFFKETSPSNNKRKYEIKSPGTSGKILSAKQSFRCHSISSYLRPKKLENHPEEAKFQETTKNLNLNNEEDFQVHFISFKNLKFLNKFSVYYRNFKETIKFQK